ncbi:MAG TPA: PIN domain-containing protein [Longimicrobium sp.]|nr:PIN domain-containing protein [Longimicrobium sp.]
MRLLLDINVVLDVALNRQPWAADAAQILNAADTARVVGYVAGHTITTAFYVISKAQGSQAALVAVSDLLRFLDVVAVEKADLHQAIALGMRDFEDAVQAACALKVGADYIVTRNEKDFQGLPIAARSPGSILPLI